MKYIQLIFLVPFFFLGCQTEDDPPVFETEQSSLFFSLKDTTTTYTKFLRVATFKQAGEWANRDHILAIPIQVLGPKSNRDRKIAVFLNEEFTTFRPDQVKLSEPVIQAGQYQDTLYVTLNNLDAYYSYYPYLTLDLKPNSDFQTVRDNSRLAIIYSEYAVPSTYIQIHENYIFSDL